MIDWQRKYKDIKDFLFSLINKEFLIFLFFVAFSTAFWFLSTLNEFFDREIDIPVKLTEIPENIIITEPLPDTIHVTIHDKGYNLLDVALSANIQPLHLVFRLYAGSHSKGNISPSEIQKILRPRFSETATIVSIKADHWDFYFNHGKKKKVPIILDSSISTKSNYYVARNVLTPDSAIVYAGDDALDTINAVYTKHLQLDNIRESGKYDVGLAHIRGAKIMPEKTEVNVITDQLTEMTLSIPIRTINVPENVMLKTFPARADVRVAIGVRQTNTIKPEMFTVIVDYNDVPASATEKIPVKIITQPKGVVKATLKHNAVDYLIEK